MLFYTSLIILLRMQLYLVVNVCKFSNYLRVAVLFQPFRLCGTLLIKVSNVSIFSQASAIQFWSKFLEACGFNLYRFAIWLLFASQKLSLFASQKPFSKCQYHKPIKTWWARIFPSTLKSCQQQSKFLSSFLIVFFFTYFSDPLRKMLHTTFWERLKLEFVLFYLSIIRSFSGLEIFLPPGILNYQ